MTEWKKLVSGPVVEVAHLLEQLCSSHGVPEDVELDPNVLLTVTKALLVYSGLELQLEEQFLTDTELFNNSELLQKLQHVVDELEPFKRQLLASLCQLLAHLADNCYGKSRVEALSGQFSFH